MAKIVGEKARKNPTKIEEKLKWWDEGRDLEGINLNSMDHLSVHERFTIRDILFEQSKIFYVKDNNGAKRSPKQDFIFYA